MSVQILTKEQKEAVGLLSIGTFLEYFDLMLYVHMAVLLNDLFFSKTDNFSSSLLSAFSFCATFIFRPIGALLIGWLGDSYGRKSTIIITSLMMGLSCIAMANLPSYDQIGITASIAVTLCRILQGMSSMGERIGAEIYLTEIIRPPKVYPVVAFISIATSLGVSAALLIANISLSQYFNWRSAFWIGAIVAFIGIFARTALRETSDFANAKKELHKLCINLKISREKLKESVVYNQKINIKSAISVFLMQLTMPLWFYLTYIHCSNILKDSFNYTPAQIIQHNLIISFAELLIVIFIIYLLTFIHPLKVLKIKFILTLPFVLICPFWLNIITSKFELMLIQSFIIAFAPTEFPIAPILYKSFPVFKRFTGACFSYSIARALMYVVSSFGIIYLIKYFGNLGLLFLFVPVIIGYGFGLFHFLELEKQHNKAGVTYIQENMEIV